MTFLSVLWTELAFHLVETSIVLAALAIAAWMLRRAPSKVEHSLWTIGLLKLAVPVVAGGAIVGAVAPSALPLAALEGLRVESGVAIADAVGGPAVRPWLAALTGFWIAGALVGLLRVGRDLAVARRIAGASRAPHEGERRRIAAMIHDASSIRVTHAPIGSAVVGLLRPVILLDVRLLAALPAAELRAVLAHEEAHRRRRDPARALVRRVVTSLFFFFPPAMLLARRLHETAEYACDEFASRSGSPDECAGALARVTRLAFDPAISPAVTGGARASLLARRLRRLEHLRRISMKPVHRIVLAGAALAVIGLTFTPGLHAGAGKTAEEVAFDQAPLPIVTVPPLYPESAKNAGVGGRVMLRLLVAADGTPSQIEVLEAVPEQPELEEAAVEAAEQWLFAPARKDGEPVPARILLPILFRTGDDEC